ncbi:hypothetical protein AB9P05_13480 [Roseivirga sp. BDSF3-8]|uniref:hypothetical protein n=1 Tax=Roseivirga sp. BDSF3-8 TaxID=3241598 RepID=UPI0035324E8D
MMIDYMLRMKHWQVFLLITAPAIFVSLLVLVNSYAFILFPAAYLLSQLTIMFWVYSVFSGLNDKLPLGSEIDLTAFRAMYLVPMVCLGILFLAMLFSVIYSNSGGDFAPGFSLPNGFGYIILAVCVFSFVSWIQGVRIAAKTIKSIERQSGLSFGEYSGEFIFIMMFGIGLWVLQPRINRIMEGDYDPQPEPLNRLL